MTPEPTDAGKRQSMFKWDTMRLDYSSQLRSKNGKLPEATLTLERLVDGPDSYGESYNVYRRK